MNPVYTFQAYQFGEASYMLGIREHEDGADFSERTVLM